MQSRRQHGAGLLIAMVAIALILVSVGTLALSSSGAAGRERASDRALAQAREALIAYAADRPIDVHVGPGYLPCPDLDDDGWAEATCGSLTGHLGQAERLGRLPWKTLGLPDLRDGHGERLWYAVSSRHKGLLNCAASRAPCFTTERSPIRRRPRAVAPRRW
jgi:type II secretory pathway pseudopilin PulG